MQAQKQFTHLHVHTEFSLLDGACRTDRMMAHLKDIGQTAVAITDHGCMFGCVDFFKAAKKEGIKPIIGCEVYVANRTRFDKVNKIDGNNHLVLLCKDEIGYKNLIKIVSKGYIEGFYNKPRVDYELLEKYSEGLICLSACLAGEVPRKLLSGDYNGAKECALRFEQIYGKGNYYIEIQDHGIEEQKIVLPQLVQLSKETNIPLVATNDAHYISKQDSKMHEILVCIQTNKTIYDEDKLEFGTDEFYLKSADEMYDRFSLWPEALENTNIIAEKCNFEFEFGVTKLPFFAPPQGMTSKEFMVKLCNEGLKKHYGDNPNQEVTQRLEYEIDVIEKMGYINYFLIVYDFIRYAKSKNIPVGPGRGSGAGSICAYCMGITDIDPIQYQLLFERFLNPERVSMPDFDIDFCYERRQEVIDYVVQKYGEEHVAQIVTFGTMAARLAIRDVGRVLDLPYQSVDTIAKLVPNELKMTLEKALKISKELKAQYDTDEKIKELIDLALKIEGMPRHSSTHAAGVVITPNEADEYVPLSTNDGNIVTQFPMTTIEELGLLKMDFLGLRTLTVLSDAEKIIKKTNPEFSLEKISYSDEKVFELISSGATLGIFQLESAGMRQVITSLKPKSIEDIIAVISLYRPGPMDSIPKYISNSQNTSKVKYKTKELESILSVTYGCIVYQEQVMQICRELAGFSYGGADIVRRAMSKKKHDVMQKARKDFIYGSNEKGNECKGCIANGINEKVASEIFDEMSNFASYAFAKSHAAAYAVVAYQTAYLKTHYTREFMAALLTSVLDNTSKIIEYTSECAHLNIKVLPPDINKSDVGFTVEEGDIRFGLLALKNVGRNLINTVVQKRKNSNYSSLYDFCKRLFGTEINRRAVESMIKAGSFDNINPNRRTLIENLEGILKSVETQSRKNIQGQLDLFETMGDSAKNDYNMRNYEEFVYDIKLQMEKEVSGLYLSGHPLEKYKDAIIKNSASGINNFLGEDAISYDGKNACIICTIVKIRTISTKSGGLMAFMTVEDLTGIMEVLVFPKTLEKCSTLLRENAVIVVKGKISAKEDEDAKLLANEIFDINENELEKLENEPNSNNGLWLKIPSRKGQIYNEIVDLLSIFEGSTPVFFYIEDEKLRIRAPKNMYCVITQQLLDELNKLLKEENVKIKN